jgi:hypothetical protein
VMPRILPWLDRLLSRRKRPPVATGYTLALPSRFDMLTMTSWRERAFWHPHFYRQELRRRRQESWRTGHYMID